MRLAKCESGRNRSMGYLHRKVRMGKVKTGNDVNVGNLGFRGPLHLQHGSLQYGVRAGGWTRTIDLRIIGPVLCPLLRVSSELHLHGGGWWSHNHPSCVAASQLQNPHLDLDVGLEPTTRRLRGSCSAIELVEDKSNLRRPENRRQQKSVRSDHRVTAPPHHRSQTPTKQGETVLLDIFHYQISNGTFCQVESPNSPVSRPFRDSTLRCLTNGRVA
jgi:hypothetical protein